MVHVILEPGDRLVVEFVETDGNFEVAYDEKGIEVSASLPDARGRQGVIYKEEFAADPYARELEAT
jgi:hypothetical protein